MIGRNVGCQNRLNILMNHLKDVENTILFFIFINVSEIWYKDIYLGVSRVNYSHQKSYDL